jgi:glutamate synthase (ferredoxin)
MVQVPTILVNEIIRDQVDKSFIHGMTADYATNYNKVTAKGILKYKIGISTLHSYRAAKF